MSSRKRVLKDSDKICRKHIFGQEDVTKIQEMLLTWYDIIKRKLPWRTEVADKTLNEKAYAVWVSEIMLQQTQVVTVISYYKKWMKKWPTLEALAGATSEVNMPEKERSCTEEVKQMWSGLGYYSRATRLHEGAQKVVRDLGGVMPDNAEALQKELPGVGRYTASAVASIVFGQVTGLVDGNVIRVFSRLKAVGADSNSQAALDKIWEYANLTVHKERPGDYNQALMELGATMCTPKNPSCATCPVQSLCRAYTEVELARTKSAQTLCVVDSNKDKKTDSDIEDIITGCHLCFGAEESWDTSLGVCNYPRKGKKKAARKEQTLVCIAYTFTSDSESSYFICQRPSTGLLAGLWEFACVTLPEERQENLISEDNILKCLSTNLDVSVTDIHKHAYIGEVVHLFSHIHQTYVVYSVELKSQCSITDGAKTSCKWVSKEEFLQSAISTAMKKVFKAYDTCNSKPKKVKKNSDVDHSGKKQLQLDAFFKRK